MRPDVVWFGETLPAEAWQAALDAAREGEVFLSIGTSSVAEPAASLPHIARQHGARVVEVNPNPTPLTPYADDVLPGPARCVLLQLVAAVWPAS